jgi:hypothetical protein
MSLAPSERGHPVLLGNDVRSSSYDVQHGVQTSELSSEFFFSIFRCLFNLDTTSNPMIIFYTPFCREINEESFGKMMSCVSSKAEKKKLEIRTTPFFL